MAHLLGSEYCIDSLRHDIKDIEETIVDVGSRVGKVNYQSWKFPDKLSGDVDVAKLLQEYKYSHEDNDEDNQVAHVMLYDLIIDRLLFILQNFTRFNEILLSVEAPLKSDQDKLDISRSVRSMSAGLTAKKCWSRVTQIATTMQHLAREFRKKSSALETELSLNTVNDDIEHYAKKKNMKAPGVEFDSSPTSEEVTHRSTQTHETSYSLCESCSISQTCLHDVGRSLVKVCKSQGLPTSLEDYIEKQTDTALMSIAELTRWKNLQTKDLSRIDRHLEGVMKKINPLKKAVSDALASEEKAKVEVKRLNVFGERREREFEEEVRKREHKLKEGEKTLKRELITLTSEYSDCKETNSSLMIQLKDVKGELLQKHRTLMATENAKSQLKEEAMEGQHYKKDAIRMQGEIADLRRRLHDAEDSLYSTNQLLSREVTKNRTLSSHEQAQQEKQLSLISRLDELNIECEEVREKMLIAENERDEIEDKVKNNGNENKKLVESLKNKEELSVILQQEKETMESKVNELRLTLDNLRQELDGHKERERILVAYPDLNSVAPAPQGSGDVLTDMENQMEANQIRIRILEKENKMLTKTLSKMANQLSSQYHSTPRVVNHVNQSPYKHEPIQLWKKSPTTTATSDDREQEFYAESHTSFGTSISTAKPRKSPTTKHNTTPTQINKSGSVYRQLELQQQMSPVRTSFSVGPGKRRPTSRPSSGRSSLLKPWS